MRAARLTKSGQQPGNPAKADSAEATIAACLKSRWDCIVIGGVRVPKSQLLLFERVINAVHRGAPDTPIAFNTSPENSGDAATRWLHDG